MAGDVTSDALTPPPGTLVGDEGTREPAPHEVRPHRNRFYAFYALLGTALAAAIYGVVVLAGQAIHPGPRWSAWHPSGSTSQMTTQLAERIGGEYRLGNGQQLLDVYPKPMTVPFSNGTTTQDVPIAAVAVQHPGQPDKISLVSDSDSRLFQLCGTGPQCSIGSGTPSVQRGLLVRREGLELALYALKYIPGVSHVIEFMPPPRGSQATLALYFEKHDLAPQLGRPLAATLNPHAPLVSTMQPQESSRIQALTIGHVFKFSLQPTQLGQAVVILSKI